MDPWGPQCVNLLVEQPPVRSDNVDRAVECAETTLRFGFEDSFSIGNSSPNSTQNEVKSQAFQPLPDSVEYLSRLEAKLKKLQDKKEKLSNKSTKGNISVLREDAFANLLHQDEDIRGQVLGITTDEDIEFDREIVTSSIIRNIAPEQPVNRGETVHLITADQLDNSHKEDEITTTEEDACETCDRHN